MRIPVGMLSAVQPQRSLLVPAGLVPPCGVDSMMNDFGSNISQAWKLRDYMITMIIT